MEDKRIIYMKVGNKTTYFELGRSSAIQKLFDGLNTRIYAALFMYRHHNLFPEFCPVEDLAKYTGTPKWIIESRCRKLAEAHKLERKHITITQSFLHGKTLERVGYRIVEPGLLSILESEMKIKILSIKNKMKGGS